MDATTTFPAAPEIEWTGGGEGWHTWAEIWLRKCKNDGMYQPVPAFPMVMVDVAKDDLPVRIHLWHRLDGLALSSLVRALLQGRRGARGGWLQAPLAPHVSSEYVATLMKSLEDAFAGLPAQIPPPFVLPAPAEGAA